MNLNMVVLGKDRKDHPAPPEINDKFGTTCPRE